MEVSRRLIRKKKPSYPEKALERCALVPPQRLCRKLWRRPHRGDPEVYRTAAPDRPLSLQPLAEIFMMRSHLSLKPVYVFPKGVRNSSKSASPRERSSGVFFFAERWLVRQIPVVSPDKSRKGRCSGAREIVVCRDQFCRRYNFFRKKRTRPEERGMIERILKDPGGIMWNVEWEQETDGRWIAEIPIIPGVMAYGAT